MPAWGGVGLQGVIAAAVLWALRKAVAAIEALPSSIKDVAAQHKAEVDTLTGAFQSQLGAERERSDRLVNEFLRRHPEGSQPGVRV